MTVYEAVVARLAMLGYTAVTADADAINFNIDKCESLLKADLNVSGVPEELFYVLVDMVVGHFLYDKKAAGTLTTFDFTAPAKQIHEGDVSVTFAGASDGTLTPEARFDAMLNTLMHPSELLLACYRRLRW